MKASDCWASFRSMHRRVRCGSRRPAEADPGEWLALPPAPLTPFDGADFDRLLDPLEAERTRLGQSGTVSAPSTPDRVRDEDLLALSRAADPGGDMHALTGVVATLLRRLRRMEPDPHPWREAVLAPMTGEAALDVHRAIDPVASPLEGHEEAVAGVVDLLAAVLRRTPSAARGRASAGAPPSASSPIRPTRSVEVTMSVNMNVFCRPRSGGDRTARPLVAQERLDLLEVSVRPEPLEARARAAAGPAELRSRRPRPPVPRRSAPARVALS